MKPPKRWPEIFVEKDFLYTRNDIIESVVKIDHEKYKVVIEHPVFGKSVDIYELDESDDTLCLKSVFPAEMQTGEDIEIVQDYLNGFILKGEETYLQYWNKDVGYYLLSRNIGVYPTNIDSEDDEDE